LGACPQAHGNNLDFDGARQTRRRDCVVHAALTQVVRFDRRRFSYQEAEAAFGKCQADCPIR